MKRISAYFISILIFSCCGAAVGQDSISYNPKIKIAADIFGPAYYIADKNLLSLEGFLSVDFDTNKAVVLEVGYLDYKYSQYNYDFLSTGYFIRVGVDFNTLKPENSKGKYFAGIGLRYGLSIFSSETPYLEHENYWGSVNNFAPPATSAAHFVEITPGIRTELFSNFSIGWTIRLRILVYSGTGKDLKSIYIPGYGNGTKSISPGINYYIMWSIPYKKRK